MEKNVTMLNLVFKVQKANEKNINYSCVSFKNYIYVYFDLYKRNARDIL